MPPRYSLVKTYHPLLAGGARGGSGELQQEQGNRVKQKPCKIYITENTSSKHVEHLGTTLPLPKLHYGAIYKISNLVAENSEGNTVWAITLWTSTAIKSS